MAELDFFSTYTLKAITEQIVPKASFFRDRYFPTAAGDIFGSDKVLTEYRRNGRKLAAFVSSRAGDVPVDREGYAIHEYQPAYIAPSRILTLDDLKKRGFGEAIYANSTPAERAAKLILQDQIELDAYIARREEWMCAQTMINNACTMQTYIDKDNSGEQLYVKFFDDSSDHAYTVGTAWDVEGGDMIGDIKAMCRTLSTNGLPVADLVLGSDAADVFMDSEEIKNRIKLDSGINGGSINEAQTQYDGVVYIGRVNIGGWWLNVFCVDETYVDDAGSTQKYFPAKSAMVTAPKCGHLMYGQITQIDYGSTMPATHVAARVPKLVIDQDKDIRKLRLGSRPLAAPHNYCPYIYAANAVN